jgi:hypothetical protein
MALASSCPGFRGIPGRLKAMLKAAYMRDWRPVSIPPFVIRQRNAKGVGRAANKPSAYARR